MKISVIIPCYKASGTIAKCLGSIFDQDYKNFEVICVLDGPDDITERLIKAFDVKYDVIEHGGACKARNHGFGMSEGDVIIFSDADCYWQPGIFRTYIETLTETGKDFVYGGFRYPDGQSHNPHEFDEYLLTTANYIDTGNPVSRKWVEEAGGFDESLKRFQDWDFWLRVVKAGAVGVKIKDLTRETEHADKESISGQDNYEETFKIVREKHVKEERPICVASPAAFGHGLRVGKMCGWDFWHDPRMLPIDYKAIYLLGCFPEGIQGNVQMFMDGRTRDRRDCKYLIHWIGTDVLHMRAMLPFIQAKNIRLMFDKYNVKHFCQSEQNAEEMRELGFDVEVLPLPVENNYKLSPMPDKFTVACYDHGGVDQKWHKWLVMELAKAMPDVDFKFFGNRNAVGKDKNTEWLGHVPMQEVIDKSSCLVRFTIHDGYPVAPVEFMFSGKKVITNVPDMPFTNYVDLGVVNDDRVPEIKQMVLREIRKVQDDPIWTSAVHSDVVKHYETLLSKEKFKKRIEEVVNDPVQAQN